MVYKTKRLFHLFIVILSVVLGLWGIFTAISLPTVHAASSWYVNAATGDDSNNCTTAGTACKTITVAIGKIMANDTVYVADGIYAEHLVITQSMTISGTGNGNVFLDGSNNGLPLDINSDVFMTLHGVTVRNGQVTNQSGGGIRNLGTLVLQNSVVISNSTNWDGGGIYNQGTLTMTQSVLADNSSYLGGGLNNHNGDVFLQDTAVQNNISLASGGGLIINGGTATLERVTVSGNQAANLSGAIHVQGNSTVALTNVTLSGNSAGNSSVMYISTGDVTILNSSIVNNMATNDAVTNAIGNGGTLSFKNSIIANSASNVMNCYSSGVLTSLGHNLADDNSCFFTQTGDQPNTNPQLGALNNNGGHTQAHALLVGSPAIDAGNNSSCPATDQRGLSRPFDGDNDNTTICDIGAYEFSRQISIADTSVLEGDGGAVTAVFTLTLTPISTQPVTVSYATADGTATAGSDYAATSGNLVFTAGQSSQTINVSILGDTTDEPNETFAVNLSNGQGAQIVDAQAAGEIVDNDGLPALVVNDATVTEGDSGASSAIFTVTLSPPSGQAVTVNYATADGTATAGSDYTAVNNTLTFSPGQTQKAISVTVQGDVVDEGNSETFVVNLSAATNAAIQDAQGDGSIIDDDTAALAVNTATVVEGDSGNTPAVFTVTLTTPSANTVTVAYATNNGSAAAGTDYIAATGILTFTPGTTAQTATVQVLGDTLDENTEFYDLRLSNAQGASIVSNSGTGYITDDDGLPSLNLFVPQPVKEGDNGNSPVSFSVMLSPASGQPVTVTYATADGTATAGSDYTAVSGTLVFTPGQTNKTIVVSVMGDQTPEANETFTMTLSNPANANLANSQGNGIILDDDSAAVEVSIADVNIMEGNGGAVNAIFSVSLNVSATAAITVDFSTANGTAVSGSDYTAITGSLTFNPGQTEKLVTVPILSDNIHEPNETFAVNLSNLQSDIEAIFQDSQGLGTIQNDDVAATGQLQFSQADFSVWENAGIGTITVSRVGGSSGFATVDYATSDGTATSGSDYTATSGTLAFADGEISKTFTIAITNDSVTENDETINLTLNNVIGGAALGSPNTTVLTITQADNLLYLPVIIR